MLKSWSIDGKSGSVVFPEGEVVYQHEPHVRVQPIFVTGECFSGREKYYIEENGKLLEAPMSPFNGYCYRQDGQ